MNMVPTKILIWAYILAIVHARTVPQAAQQTPLDIIKVGNYDIYNCGLLARDVSVQMLALQSVLRPALADANFRFPSPAYTTFFKEPLYAPFVASILSKAIRGASVLPGNVLPNENIPPSPPMIACAVDPAKNPNIHQGHDKHHWGLLTRITAFAYTYCNSSATNREAMIGGTPFIAICPHHFGYPMLPPPERCMLQKKSTGEYLESGATFANTMVGGLLHEIVHYYANSAVPPTKAPEKGSEVYTVSDCVGLKWREARLTPNCYVYYALSIYQKCRKFPDVSTKPSRRKPELLEVLVNATLPDRSPDITFTESAGASTGTTWPTGL